jgi:cytochrome P450 family 710 subfamily A protein
LLDFWSIEINEEIEAAAKAGVAAPKHSSDFEMGNTLMDFLFASQDASTASLTWIFALLDQYPEILAKAGSL